MSRNIPKTVNVSDAFTLSTATGGGASGGGGVDGTVVNPFTVYFDDTSSPASTTWAWQFKTQAGLLLGTSSQENPTFVFPSAGTYIVTLTTNNGTVTKSVVVVSNVGSGGPGAGGGGGGSGNGGGGGSGTASIIDGVQLFPSNNFWYANVSGLSERSDSAARINGTMDRDEKFSGVIGYPAGQLHCDFGTGGVGMPYEVVESTQPNIPITYHYPAGEAESDPGPMPIPLNADFEDNTDKHILVVQKGTNRLFELWDSISSGSGWDVGQSTQWELSSNDMRPPGWTSSDAAGVPVLPGLVRYEEVAAGVITHALRITVDYCSAEYEWPANHVADLSEGASSTLMKMGTWLRLKSTTDLSALDPQATIVAQALKTHGAVVVDIGPNWKLSGAPSASWNDADLSTIHSLLGTDFEVVDTSSLIVSPTSMAFATTSSGGNGGTGGGPGTGALGIVTLAGAGGGVGEFNFGSGCDHPRASGVTTAETNGNASGGTVWNPGDWAGGIAILEAAAAPFDQVILHGFSSGCAFVLEVLKRGYTFGGRLRGCIVDDPAANENLSNPANTPVKLYAVWTGSSWFVNDFYGRDWLGEIESSLGVTRNQNPYRNTHSPMTLDQNEVGTAAVPEEVLNSVWWN